MKYSNRNRFFHPARSFALVLALCASADGAIIAVPAGGLTLTAADNGANTVTGGAVATPAITVPVDVVLTGDAARTQVIDITAGAYTVTNAGTLAGTDHRGISSATVLTLNNSGTISGAGAGGWEGVATVGGASAITNSGTISGTNTGIRFTTAGTGAAPHVTNTGSISGLTGAASDGIAGTAGLIIRNNGAGSISGNQNGITATTTLNVINDTAASITGGTTGIQATDSANITNAGTITGATGNGITAGNLAAITNSGTISGQGAASNGIVLGTTTTGAITNNAGGLISGTLNGITGGAGAETIINSGTITGGTFAMDLGAGNDTVTLNDGSLINGAIDFGAGTDTLTLNGGQSSLADPTGNVINGALTNLETLNKAGADTAFINGAVSTNTVSVTGGGALYINGDMAATTPGSETAVTVTGSGIGGTGTWDASITMTGASTISPGASPLALAAPLTDAVGVLTVDGRISLDASSAYRWNIDPVTNAADLIQTTFKPGDTFTVANSAFVIAPTSMSMPILDGNRIVVDTGDTLVGNFAAVTVAGLTNPILASFSTLTQVNGGQDWQLSIVHDYGAFGANPNQVAAGNALTAMVPTATGDMAAMLATLDYNSADVTRDTLAALDPAAYFAGIQALATTNYRLHRILEQQHHIARQAGGDTVRSTSSTPPPGGYAKGGVVDSIFCGLGYNLWGSFDYSWQDMSAGNGALDFDGETAAVTAGFDVGLAGSFRLGAVIDGSWARWDAANGNSQDVDSMRLGGYFNWGEATGFFLQGFGGYQTGSISQSRKLAVGGVPTLAKTDYDADGWQGMIAIGYTAATGFGTLTPYAGFEGQSISVDDFSETGSPLPLSVSGMDIDSTRFLIGLAGETGFVNTTVYFGVAYAHELEDDAPTANASFGGASYLASGVMPNDALLLSAGARWALSESTTLHAGYGGELSLDDDGLDSHGINLGLNYSF